MPRDQWKKTVAACSGQAAPCEEKKDAGTKKKLGGGTSTLFSLIRSQDWPECLKRCSSHPEDMEHVEYGNSALHYALHKRPEIDDSSPNPKEAAFLQLIDCLLKAKPWLLSSVDVLGYTPLHIVCSKNPSALLVQLILKYCPPTARSLQPMLSLPLEVTKQILEFVPNPAVTKDKHGKTPLFLACQRSKKRRNERINCEVVRLLCDYAPAAAGIKDNTLRAPIDVVDRHQKNVEEIVELLGTASRWSESCTKNS